MHPLSIVQKGILMTTLGTLAVILLLELLLQRVAGLYTLAQQCMELMLWLLKELWCFKAHPMQPQILKQYFPKQIYYVFGWMFILMEQTLKIFGWALHGLDELGDLHPEVQEGPDHHVPRDAR